MLSETTEVTRVESYSLDLKWKIFDEIFSENIFVELKQLKSSQTRDV